MGIAAQVKLAFVKAMNKKGNEAILMPNSLNPLLLNPAKSGLSQWSLNLLSNQAKYANAWHAWLGLTEDSRITDF